MADSDEEYRKLFAEKFLGVEPNITLSPDTRYTGPTLEEVRKGKRTTHHVNFRLDSVVYQRIEEICASKVDPRYDTLTAFFRDGVTWNVVRWDERFPDGAGGLGAFEFLLWRQNREIERWEAMAETFRNLLESCQRTRDVRRIRALRDAQQALDLDAAPPTVRDDIERCMEKTERLYQDSL